MSEVIFIPFASSLGPIPSVVPTALEVWWDSVDGSDTNDGVSDTTPVLSFARVVPFLAQAKFRPVLIRTASGTYDFSGGIPSLAGINYMVCFWADPAWDPRGDLMVAIASGVAGVGTTGETVVLPAPVTVNLYEAKSLRFLTGNAANGQMRSITQHPTTAITPSLIMNPAPAAGDTFQVFRSNAVIRCTGNRLSADNPGNVINASTPTAGVAFVNLDLGLTTTTQLGPGYYLSYGMRTSTAVSSLQLSGPSSVCFGINISAGLGILATQFGMPQHLWGGWGWMVDDSSASLFGTQPSTYFDGFVVTKGAFGLSGRQIVRGGSAQVLNCFTQTAILRVIGASTTLPFQFGATTRSNSVINFAVTFAQAGILHMSNCVLRHSGAGSALLLQGALFMIIETTVTGENPLTTTMNISRGARVVTTGALNLGRAVGSDIVVESAAAINKSALTAAGATSILADPTFPGSFLRRAG